ncbi:MAG: HU family DNA-binding protein [Luteolibacter sp.]
MKTTTKKDLVTRITDRLGEDYPRVTRQQVLDVIQVLLDEMSDSLASGNPVALRKFGSFRVEQTKAKVGRNPKNPKQTFPIPARFKPSTQLKEMCEPALNLIRTRG